MGRQWHTHTIKIKKEKGLFSVQTDRWQSNLQKYKYNYVLYKLFLYSIKTKAEMNDETKRMREKMNAHR